ncbi:hypothetical protein A2713_00785 [candidate division WWE3 bacterium RIFCSPHIGHO2_01_FULL_35_17]|uniref:Aminoacyl-transfer RNA synthetases class-II family profile domain-containing protein n=1 Tax=candidate division WWE3 bacterium RIFCSPHIGHO2_01_FULL_35_17 TaxID=1802614 RepID=A0A1F4UQZ1_UNCKA|nr:MAG: hypothetical protein A2713_00785 [candidate division WWE3 bacterium RIFCSPHIGHO2_01_FULL_35_17]
MQEVTTQLPIEQLRQIRIDKLNKLRKLGVDPYPAKSNRTNVISDVIDSFENFDSKKVIVAGRVLSIRHHGKLIFIDIKDQSGKLQVYLKESDLEENPNRENSELSFSEVTELIDVSDFVEIKGIVTKTPRGEISIVPSYFRVLTKALRAIPQELKDKEVRYRKRYLDTNIHQDVFDRFIRRAKFWEAHRDFFRQNGFLEMNIPVLESVIGGGDATPFITHMNAIDEDFYLRISQELPLKKLIGAGYEKIYEIGPRFRNEGLSDEHLPEHMAMEFYWAYADWEDGMKFIQDLINYVIGQVYPGKTSFDIRGFKDIKFNEKWEILDFKKVFKEKFDIEDVYNITQAEVEEKVRKYIKNVDFKINIPRGVDNLWKLVRKDVKGPAFLINHPKYLSPLQKPDKLNPLMVNRFQPIIAGSELGNGWSEITDAIDQYERFAEQEKLRKSGDKEAQMMDIDYVEMLEYGMPPTFGWGHSERLFWFLENISAKEGVIFPTMKHEISAETRRIYGMKEEIGTKVVGKNGVNDYLISNEIKSDFPDISFAYTTISGVDIKKSNKDLEEFKKSVVDRSSKILMDEISNIPSLVSYRDLFRKSGTDFHSKRPSPEALLRRVIQGKGIYNINTAVDAYNLAVLESHIGLGGFDFDQISEPVVLRYSKDGEKMKLLGDDDVTTTREGQVIYADSNGPITLDLNYRDIDKTKITEKTKNVILFADGGVGISEDDVMSALKKGAEYIQKFCGGTISKIVLVN